MVSSRGLGDVYKRQVYSKRTNETAHFVLVESIFNSTALVKVLPPLYIYDENGTYTKEVEEIYYG